MSRSGRFLYYKEFKSYWLNPSGPGTLEPVRLCIGGEWYLYPSSFYVPQSNIRVSFLRSDFHGQLPQPFPVSGEASFVSWLLPRDTVTCGEISKHLAVNTLVLKYRRVPYIRQGSTDFFTPWLGDLPCTGPSSSFIDGGGGMR